MKSSTKPVNKMKINLNQKKVTIADVAKAAGVSKTTVSRYINGRKDLMGLETQKRIQDMIDLLDYHPSDTARSLKSKKSNMIGVLVSDITSPFFSAIIAGIGEVLTKADYVPLFVNCENSPEKETKFIQSLLMKDVDGLIVNPCSPENNLLIQIACEGLPVVLCDRMVHNFNFDLVTIQNEKLVQHLITHLKAQGYTRVAFFSQDFKVNIVRQKRRDYYLRFMQDIFGYDASQDVYVFSDDPQEQLEQVQHFLASVGPDEKPALLCANSITTVRAYQTIKKLGLHMPDQLGLCGTDDWDWENGMSWIDLCETSVTTQTFSPKEIGRNCAKLILEKIDSPQAAPKKIYVDSTLFARESTALAKAAGNPQSKDFSNKNK